MTEECSMMTVNSCKKGIAKLVNIPRASHCKLIDEPQLCEPEACICRVVETRPLITGGND